MHNKDYRNLINKLAIMLFRQQTKCKMRNEEDDDNDGED